ncbi:RNA-directed DNA polymerase, eukaryota, reverse transcriptase zinc-binding domain protein [Tanacetum coccineum]|uniref:RNA-directed DNA polymerase, eukaryota, reverse transcriptase zinc-binding domain protein n=1 Tax=Tanacetum coccineum TaxID=301880 RepID=A0ABQ5HNF9_9ASTR
MLKKSLHPFFVTNFPESLDAKGLWREFQSFGRIVDAFIANKRSKIGKRFGFVRFLGISNVDAFVNTLSNIWMGSYHVFVSVAKFQRQNKTESIPLNKDFLGLKNLNVTQFRNSTGSNSHHTHSHKPFFASVASGDGDVKRSQNNVNQHKDNHIILKDLDLITVDDTSTVVLVKVKEVDSINNIYRICKNEGFDDSNESLQNVWSAIRVASPSFTIDERMVWIEITGLPLCAWGSNAYKKVASVFGKFQFFDSDVDDNMSLGRVCIATKIPSFIAESVKAIIHGRIFDVNVKEVSTWNTNIENDLECNDSEGIQEDDDHSFNIDHNDILDDFIEQVVEKKYSFSTNEVQEKINIDDQVVSGDTCSKPPGFETLIKEDALPDEKSNEVKDSKCNGNNVNPKKETEKSVDSNGSIPPGFDNFVTGAIGTSPFYKSRSSKCSTSFGNCKSKIRKGFSFINEINKMIEVGGALGYDVKGCKRSFRKMINGMGIQETKMTKLELFKLKSMWGNFTFDYECSMARGRFGGLVTIWDPNVFSKSQIWCSDNFIIVEGKWLNATKNYYLINVYDPQQQPDKANLWESLRIFIQQHDGHFILFGDLNEVRCEDERFGSSFSSSDAMIFNSFIQDVGLIDLSMGGKMYTWMNKIGSKLSKLDRFLVLDGVLTDHPHLQATVLDKLWSDHNPILLHCKFFDFGPTPFKLFHSWFDRNGFDDVVKEAWNSYSYEGNGSILTFHKKLRGLKSHLKLWYSRTKESEQSTKRNILLSLRTLEEKIDAGCVNDEDRDLRVNKLLELESLDKLESVDLIQKARLKWDVEGDKNSKFFHGIINSKRKSRMINGILHEGEWITDPIAIKSALLNFFKVKFSRHDTSVTFPPIVASKRLSDYDVIFLDSMVSLEEIKSAVWDCSSQKASGPMGFRFYLSRNIGILFTMIFNVLLMAFSLQAGLSSSRASILVNGSPTSEFSLKRGLRQGDPLSLFLFIIVMEGLNIMLKDGLAANLFRARLSSWKANLLSLAGRLTLIKAVLGSLGFGCGSINGGRTLADLNSFLMDLSSVILSNDVDVVSSSLSSDGIYSVSDVRIHIDDCVLLNSLPFTRWFKAIPRKVNIFMWHLFLDRLPHRLNLSSWGLDIDSIMCPLCNKHVESNSHVFFTCDTACGVWSLVRG